MRMLLLSNSTNHGETFLAHARERIAEFARGEPVSFVPFALADWDGYTERVRNALGSDVVGVHRDGQPARAIAEARCLLVGGGNTFRLLDALYRLGVLEVLRRRVRSGELAYAGASAGTNIAAPTIRTTNDMPIVDPPGLAALGLVPFQINPLYVDADPGSTLMAETRAERLAQFLEVSDVAVVALYEGAWIEIDGDDRRIGGKNGALVFHRGGTERLGTSADLDRWWRPGSFDVDRVRFDGVPGPVA